MEALASVADGTDKDTFVGGIDNFDLGFLPENLTTQCQSLIVSYHGLHGYAELPNILWKARLGHFIEAHQDFRQLLRKASTTRSAKRSNENFVLIATAILSLEILASSFAGWSAIYPQAGSIARAILQQNTRGPYMPLMEFYLYPPKYISSAALATLAPPHLSAGVDLYRMAKSEIAGDKLAPSYVGTIRHAPRTRPLQTAAASPGLILVD